MPNQPTEQVILDNLEDGEELCCETPHQIHCGEANPAPLEILPVRKAQHLSEFLGYLADPNRLRIISILAVQEMCVGDLAAVLEMNESAVSHQLRTLRAIRLVNFRKQGRHVFYNLQDRHILTFYQAAIDHLDETV